MKRLSWQSSKTPNNTTYIPQYTLWLINIAMENGSFIDDFPSYKPPFIYGIFHGYVSHNQRVNHKSHDFWFFRWPRLPVGTNRDRFRAVPLGGLWQQAWQSGGFGGFGGIWWHEKPGKSRDFASKKWNNSSFHPEKNGRNGRNSGNTMGLAKGGTWNHMKYTRSLPKRSFLGPWQVCSIDLQEPMDAGRWEITW